MKLSKRMEALAGLVSDGVRLADIGCDHAYLPIELCRRGRIPSALAMDLRPGPLAAAREHILEAGLQERIETRLSDGMREMQPGEADAVMISGMGGGLVCRILQEGERLLPELQELILGPQSDEDAVRHFLYDRGFVLDREAFVEEEGKTYMLLHAVPAGAAPAGTARGLTEAEAVYGPCLLRQRDPGLLAALRKKQSKLQHLQAQLADAPSEKGRRRAGELSRDLRILEEALVYFGKDAEGTGISFADTEEQDYEMQ